MTDLLLTAAGVLWWPAMFAAAGGFAVLAVTLAPSPARQGCRLCGRRQAVDHSGLCEPCREKN